MHIFFPNHFKYVGKLCFVVIFVKHKGHCFAIQLHICLKVIGIAHMIQHERALEHVGDVAQRRHRFGRFGKRMVHHAVFCNDEALGNCFFVFNEQPADFFCKQICFVINLAIGFKNLAKIAFICR